MSPLRTAVMVAGVPVAGIRPMGTRHVVSFMMATSYILMEAYLR